MRRGFSDSADVRRPAHHRRRTGRKSAAFGRHFGNPMAQPQGQPMQEQPPGGLDVLIMEDERLDAFLLEDILVELGHRVVGIARTREEALALAKAKRPGLLMGTVLLDDGNTGIEAVEEILHFARVPVVFVTGMSEEYVKDRRREPTFVVRKPPSFGEIAVAIRAALDYESARAR
jgi:DNA-binding response OmpR family regulator